MKENDEPNATPQMTNHEAGNLDLSARPIRF